MKSNMIQDLLILCYCGFPQCVKSCCVAFISIRFINIWWKWRSRFTKNLMTDLRETLENLRILCKSAPELPRYTSDHEQVWSQ